MRVLICDDDELIAKQLETYIKKYFESTCGICPELALFHDGASLLSDTGEKDMVFLDIEMPGMNGIYVGNELKSRNENVIIFIVTSFAEYLDDAMRFHIFRYLSKPIDKQRLFRNLKDAMSLYNNISVRIPVETKQGVHAFYLSSIISVEACSRKVIVHTLSGDFESTQNMQYFLEVLPESCFFRTHRSFIVNFRHVTDFDHMLVHLSGDLNAYLTRRKYSEFKKKYFFYIYNTK